MGPRQRLPRWFLPPPRPALLIIVVGGIVDVSSIAAVMRAATMDMMKDSSWSAYSISKAGIDMLNRATLAHRRENIRTYTINPAVYATAMVKGIVGEQISQVHTCTYIHIRRQRGWYVCALRQNATRGAGMRCLGAGIYLVCTHVHAVSRGGSTSDQHQIHFLYVAFLPHDPSL